MYALINCRLYTGYEQLNNYAILIDEDKIGKICKQDALPANIDIVDVNNAVVAPGFIDLQVNGCGGVQFNETVDALSIETLEQMQTTNLRSGCTSFLPTLITSSDEFMEKAVAVMRDYLQIHKNQALGLHLEGPYINSEKKGIHDEKFIRPPSQKMINFLSDNADVIKIITLAPEKVADHYIHQLAEAGIKVSVGHSNGNYEDCCRGFKAGITMGTHLFNAMPYIAGRAPGIVGAIYDTPAVYAGIIADGEHVHFANIRNSHKIKQDHLILITDAMLLAGSNLASTQFGGKTIYHKAGRCVDANGTLAGSALTMIKAVENSVKQVGIELDEVLRMATLYPAKAIGMDNVLGTLNEGKVANLVIFNDDFTVIQTVVNGVMSQKLN
ncbi:N-acetylglucosamine-6-phosphate deacetylase [Orbaceae bacterium ESL0721]|nr:N-acetylglucosamine-6-phosphate deacetylase [Orbaceae bacterium ESL0721]